MPWIVALLALALFALSLTPPGVSLRRWLMARFYAATLEEYEVWVADRKRRLFATVEGVVLELGPGTGANFPYYSQAVTRWIGLEPNVHMHPQLRAAAERSGLEAEFRSATAEGMEVADGSVDAVVCTLVLCSLADPARVLADVVRVLKPGGRFVFLEHVAAPRGTGLRRLQRLVKPAWRYFADGCRPDRETERLIRAAGFSAVELEAFTAPKPAMPKIVSPQIAGTAVK